MFVPNLHKVILAREERKREVEIEKELRWRVNEGDVLKREIEEAHEALDMIEWKG